MKTADILVGLLTLALIFGGGVTIAMLIWRKWFAPLYRDRERP